MTATERVRALAQRMRQRQEEAASAQQRWLKALPQCRAIALEIAGPLASLPVRVDVVDEEILVLALPAGGARCEFRFDGTAALCGHRFIAGSDKDAAGENFFSCPIRPPVRAARSQADIGPSWLEEPASATIGSREAFEKAVADFLEWALVGPGANGQPQRLA